MSNRVVITAAAGGIGRAMAEAFLANDDEAAVSSPLSLDPPMVMAG